MKTGWSPDHAPQTISRRTEVTNELQSAGFGSTFLESRARLGWLDIVMNIGRSVLCNDVTFRDPEVGAGPTEDQ